VAKDICTSCKHCRKLDYSQAVDLGVPIGSKHGIIVINKKDLWNLVKRTSVDSALGRKFHQAVEYTVGDFLVKEMRDEDLDTGPSTRSEAAPETGEERQFETKPGAEPAEELDRGGQGTADGKEVMVFNFGGYGMTSIVGADGNPWFVAKEVCTILGTSTRDIPKILDGDEMDNVDSIHFGRKGGKPLRIINESGLYSLILRSRKPEAKKFKKWVTGEVLPTIRKTGRFDVKAPKTDKARALFFAQQFIEESARNERLTHENVKLSAEKARMSEIIEEAQPRLDAHGEFIDAREMYSLRSGAKLCGLGPNRFSKTLRHYGYLMDNNLPQLVEADVGKNNSIKKGQYSMMCFENLDINGKVVAFDQRFDIGLFGARFLMERTPESVVITRDNEPVGILVNEDHWAQQNEFDISDAIRIPESLIETWLDTCDGSFFMFLDMLMENKKSLSFDLGADTGRVIFLPADYVPGIDLEHAIFVDDDCRMEFKFHLAQPHFKEDFGRDFSLDEYKNLYVLAYY